MTDEHLKLRRRRDAFHEAGHAALAVYFERTFDWTLGKVIVTGDGKTSRVDRIYVDDADFSRRIADGDEHLFQAEIMYLLAGVVTEKLAGFNEDEIFSISRDGLDIEAVFRRAPRMSPQRDRIVRELRERAEKLLMRDENWKGIERLAEALINECEVTGNSARTLLGITPQSPER